MGDQLAGDLDLAGTKCRADLLGGDRPERVGGGKPQRLDEALVELSALDGGADAGADAGADEALLHLARDALGEGLSI